MLRTLILLLLLTIVSCNSSDPFESFTDDVLVDILFDVSLANTMAENTHADLRDSVRNVFLDQIATIHKLERIMIDSIIDHVHLDNKRFLIIADSLDRKLKRNLESIK